MKPKYFNNRPVHFSNPELVNIGDCIEINNPPRGVNFWEVLNKEQLGNTMRYTVKMVKGSAFVGSIYVMEYEYKTVGKIAPITAWFFQKQYALNNIPVS
jgi:hypothetical protein